MNLMAKEIAHDRTGNFSLVGKEFGTYKIEKPIGAGGMGEVYLAHDDKLNRKVAMKILPAEFVADAERVKRFEREAQNDFRFESSVYRNNLRCRNGGRREFYRHRICRRRNRSGFDKSRR